MAQAGRVGFFVFLFIAMLGGTYAILQRSVFAPATATYFAEFKDAGGVTSGAKVLLAGVQVGSVSKVELGKTGKALVTLAIADGTTIAKGTTAVLPSSLIGIGDRQIELVAPEASAGVLAAGSTLPGEIRSPLSAFAPDSGDTIKALEQTLKASAKLMESTEKLVSDKALKSDMQKLMQQSAMTAEAFGKLAGRLDSAMAQNQATIVKMLKNGEAISGDLASMSNKFAGYVKSGKLEAEADKLFAGLNQALDQGRALVGDMRAVTGDLTTQENLKAIVANTQEMSKSGTVIAKNAETLTAKGIEVSDEVISLMKKANKLAEEAEGLFTEIKKKLVGGGGGGLMDSVKKISAQLDGHRESSPDRWRTDFSIKIPTGKNQSIHLGVWDAFESNKLTLQAGRPLGKGELKYGVYASKPGVGFDVPVSGPLSLRADLFGVNKTRFDAKANFRVNKNADFWLGFDRIFDRNTPGIGFGIRP